MTAEAKQFHVVCPHCDAINRLPANRLAESPVCGKCRHSLMPGLPVEIAAKRFDRQLASNDIPVVVDFWAPWCGPCRTMAPAFSQAAKALPAIRFLKVNTELEPALAQRFNIRSIPTLAIFHAGREVARQAGATDAGNLQRWIAQVVS